jgi:hypothetical protein
VDKGYTSDDVESKEWQGSLDREQPEISREQKLEQVLNEVVRVINKSYMAQDVVLVEEDLNWLLREVGVDILNPSTKIVVNERI